MTDVDLVAVDLAAAVFGAAAFVVAAFAARPAVDFGVDFAADLRVVAGTVSTALSPDASALLFTRAAAVAAARVVVLFADGLVVALAVCLPDAVVLERVAIIRSLLKILLSGWLVAMCQRTVPFLMPDFWKAG